MNFDDWIKTLPSDITGDALWSMEVYRLALFLSEIGWYDVTKLMGDKRTLDLSDQLYRALGSISANISEGYSRSSGKDQARFYEYALGSARESRGWYYQSRHVLNESVASHRIDLLTQTIRLLHTIIPKKRGYSLHEDQSIYSIHQNHDQPFNKDHLNHLLKEIPLP